MNFQQNTLTVLKSKPSLRGLNVAALYNIVKTLINKILNFPYGISDASTTEFMPLSCYTFA